VARRLTVTLGVIALASCGGGGDVERDVTADRCLVDLHGKGGRGGDPTLVDDVAVLRPDGNGDGWGGREWRYDDDDDRRAAIDIVRRSVEGAACERVVVHGFSNGAAFAAAMVCSGDTLDDRLVGVVVDDPVTDAATVDCRADPAVPSALYWTGALDATAPPGTESDTVDWTCAGGRVRGIDVFAAELGVTVTASPFDDHRRFDDAPEPARWLSG
jgi:hypothetical protein